MSRVSYSTAHRHCAYHTFACIAMFEDIRQTRSIASSMSCSSTDGVLTQSPHSFENLGVRKLSFRRTEKVSNAEVCKRCNREVLAYAGSASISTAAVCHIASQRWEQIPESEHNMCTPDVDHGSENILAECRDSWQVLQRSWNNEAVIRHLHGAAAVGGKSLQKCGLHMNTERRRSFCI